jgi:hypothetical protein
MSEDFDLKLKRQEAGMIDKKTGKVSPLMIKVHKILINLRDFLKL